MNATHNPEFTICEFYQIMTSLDELKTMTETIFNDLAQITKTSAGLLLSDSLVNDIDFAPPFRTLEFIPSLERAICEHIPGWTFPDLDHATSSASLLSTLKELKVQVPASPTLPRLLDVFSARFLETQCIQPTFIIHHPECMSPLSKSFVLQNKSSSPTPHRVSARAELFIKGIEYVNCYEEENSPLEQRRKFEEQLLHRADEDGETHQAIDESYLRALEWGMPPTGGWGCGVDRIVMLFAGKSRIADVIPFGTLRNVVGLGSGLVKRLNGSKKEIKEFKKTT